MVEGSEARPLREQPSVVWDAEQTLREDLPIDLYERVQGILTEQSQNPIFDCTIEEYLENARSDSDELVTNGVKHRLEKLGYA